ncbi:hypothetical protein [Desulfitobacterium sp. THU1]|uniref:hypothetical protein n=1 Tax=Desulfitobacterium sp. THU1 TaxID=3138072 RepID=UPI00311FDD27
MYLRAGLPNNDPNRLTNDTVKTLNRVFKQAPRFGKLEIGKQMEIIKLAISMKENAINLLIKEVIDSSRV